MKIILPWPDRKLMPNRKNGRSWMSSQKAKEDARIAGRNAVIEQGQLWQTELAGSIKIGLIFCPPDKRRRDLDNLFSSMKHTLDGVASALGVDDSQFRPVLLDFGDVVKGGQVVMTLDKNT